MVLPNNVRRVIDHGSRIKIWVYGEPFSGKSTLADTFPDPIFLNTDGNCDSFTAPLIEVKAQYSNGLLVQQPWEVFVSAVEELARGNHGYRTVVVDLIEDVFEHCRTYCCNRMGIEHESDNNFKAWDYVSVHFLSVMKQLTTLPMNVVLLSHAEHRDIVRRNGERISMERPILRDKVANKIAGMVDLVTYLSVDDDGRHLNFKTSTAMFGGGRLQLSTNRIECSYDAIATLYGAQRGAPPMGMAPQGGSSSTSFSAGQSFASVSTQGSMPPQLKPVARNMTPPDGIPYEPPALQGAMPPAQFSGTIQQGTMGNQAPVSTIDDDVPF